MRHLIDVLCVVFIDEFYINFTAVITFRNVLITQDFCRLENALSEHVVKEPFSLFIGQRRITDFGLIEFRKLNFKVIHQCIIIIVLHLWVILLS